MVRKLMVCMALSLGAVNTPLSAADTTEEEWTGTKFHRCSHIVSNIDETIHNGREIGFLDRDGYLYVLYEIPHEKSGIRI